jgi:hypothetical protein
MSDTPTSETKASEAAAAAATAEKPAAPAEPPFNVDELLNCTARMTHKAWHLFYGNRKDMDFIRKVPVRASLEARTVAGAEEMHKILVDAGVTTISRSDKVLSFTGTYEQIQTVIKHPQSFMLDTVKI